METPSTAIYAGSLLRAHAYQTSGVHTTPQVNWTFSTETNPGDSSSGKDISTSVLVSNDIAYFGSEDGYLYAIHTSHGKLLWRFASDCVSIPDNDNGQSNYSGDGITALCITGTTGYITTACGTLSAIDLHLGQHTQSWKLDQLIDFEGDWDWVHDLTISNDLLIISSQAKLSVFNHRTGTVVHPDLYPLSYPPTLFQHMLYGLESQNNQGDTILLAYNLHDGNTLWRSSYEEDDWKGQGLVINVSNTNGTLPLINDTLFAMGHALEKADEGSGLLALDPLTGNIKWTCLDTTQYDPVGFSLAAANGLIYLQAAGKKRIEAVDMNTGQLRWSWQADEHETLQSLHIPPVLTDSLLYQLSTEGQLTALDALTGKVKWTCHINGNSGRFCGIANSTLYVVMGQTLSALREE